MYIYIYESQRTQVRKPQRAFALKLRHWRRLTHTHTNTHTHIHTHTERAFALKLRRQRRLTRMHDKRMHVCTHMHTHAHACTRMHTHAHACTRTDAVIRIFASDTYT